MNSIDNQKNVFSVKHQSSYDYENIAPLRAKKLKRIIDRDNKYYLENRNKIIERAKENYMEKKKL